MVSNPELKLSNDDGKMKFYEKWYAQREANKSKNKDMIQVKINNSISNLQIKNHRIVFKRLDTDSRSSDILRVEFE